MFLIILQEPDGFVEHDFPLQSFIEFLPMYHIYPSSLPCIVISTEFIKLTGSNFPQFLLEPFKKAGTVLANFRCSVLSLF